MSPLGCYREVWCVDFEFAAPPGHRPTPHCVVARELRSGRRVRAWLADDPPPAPPYPTGPDALFVAYYASAELGCHLALGWPLPVRVLDLYAEFRNRTNGRDVPCGTGLLGALAYHGLDGVGAAEKDAMRALALRGGPYAAAERAALLAYCETDVDALARLLPRLLPALDLPRALLRGRYMAAAARMEWAGVPVDGPALARLRAGWEGVKGRLVRAVDRDYRVFAPADPRRPDGPLRFSVARWADYLARAGIPWPRLPSGALAACLATEGGLTVCCPVHDAFLIEADADRAGAATDRMRAAMRAASELVLPGFPLETDAAVVRHPDRFADPRGGRMWALVTGLLKDLSSPAAGTPATGDTQPLPPVAPPPSLISGVSLSTLGIPTAGDR